MHDLDHATVERLTRAAGAPLNLSRRGFLSAATGALTLAVALPAGISRAQDAGAIQPGTRVPAFLEIHPDGSILFRSPFVEGGQGVYTSLAQIIAEELDADLAAFEVVTAPAGLDYLVMGGMRFTGGSGSVRSSYEIFRRLGAAARAMLMQAAAERLGVPTADLMTEPGRVVHAASGRSLSYGALAKAAMALEPPTDVALKDPSQFRWIGRSPSRLDVRDKSTGRAEYGVDLTVPDMLLAAVQHAPRLGQDPAALLNRADVEAMPGVHSIHLLPGAVAVVADRWWRARRAVEALEVDWRDGADVKWPLPADFSTAGFKERLLAEPGPGIEFEAKGDAAEALDAATVVVEAVYDAPFVMHGQLEPPSAIARFNEDGTLDLWTPNQAPEMFQAAAARIAGLEPQQVNIHSPMLGGFFGRHFLYETANPFPQAILLAKAVGRPVKVLWSREEEFLRDAMRPLGVARFRAALDANGMPLALSAEMLGEGPSGRWYGLPAGKDGTAVEGVAGKVYAIRNTRVGHVYLDNPAVIGYWRAVGHSMNDYFYESFLDELAAAGGQDPMALRRALLSESPRHLALLDAVSGLAGGWRRGPYEAEDGGTRARGVALASPFGSEVATIAEVSIEDGEVRAHHVWVAIDPGSIVNPAIVEAQVQSAVALGLSQTLLEEVIYKDGAPVARNFDMYPILPPHLMPQVHVTIVESGAPMGGIGEPGLPGVGPAVVNAVATLTGKPVRSLPLAKHDFSSAG